MSSEIEFFLSLSYPVGLPSAMVLGLLFSLKILAMISYG